jgi:hypothetical protein
MVVVAAVAVEQWQQPTAGFGQLLVGMLRPLQRHTRSCSPPTLTLHLSVISLSIGQLLQLWHHVPQVMCGKMHWRPLQSSEGQSCPRLLLQWWLLSPGHNDAVATVACALI